MKSKFLKLLNIVFLLVAGSFVAAESKIFSWDFSDCDIRDLLFAVSMDTGISIIGDDTVSGKGNFRFTGVDFEKAFDSFLVSQRLYVEKNKDNWIVSKIKLACEDGKYCLDAFDLNASLIVERISKDFKSIVTFDSLPGGIFSVHLKDLSEKELLENLVKRFSGYELSSSENGFHIGKKNGNSMGSSTTGGFVQVGKKSNGSIFIDVRDCRILDVLNRLFEFCEKDCEKEFCFLAGNDGKVLRSCFSGKDFDDVLNKFCIQNGLGIVISDGIYYIVSESGSREKISDENKQWEKIYLDYIKADKFIGILGKRLGKVETISLGSEFEFLCKLSGEDWKIVQEIKKTVDQRENAFLVELKYLKPEELMKQLPPDVDRNCFVLTEDKSCVYFKGSRKNFEDFKKDLILIDKPVQRISYDLLILQFENGMEDTFNGKVSFDRISAGDRNNFGVKLGNVMNLNLNVISTFGIDFAASMESSIENNKTKIFADTTLWGICGKPISFQNTNTYRYRDNNLDPDTGKPVYSGVTKEIISGLKLDVTGWISGDGMITSSVTASVTRRGNDSSSATGNPPPTSEKIITTEVRGKNGEPVILSGLIENSQSISESHTPLLWKIPLIGWLFRGKENIKQNSQMVIYLVPHIEQEIEIKKTADKENEGWIIDKCNSLIDFFRNEAVSNE